MHQPVDASPNKQVASQAGQHKVASSLPIFGLRTPALPTGPDSEDPKAAVILGPEDLRMQIIPLFCLVGGFAERSFMQTAVGAEDIEDVIPLTVLVNQGPTDVFLPPLEPGDLRRLKVYRSQFVTLFRAPPFACSLMRWGHRAL